MVYNQDKSHETTAAVTGVKTYGLGGETEASRLGSAIRSANQIPVTPPTQSPGASEASGDWVGYVGILVLVALGGLFWLFLQWVDAFGTGMRIEATRRAWFPLGQGAVILFVGLWPILTAFLLAVSLGFVTRDSDRAASLLRVTSLAIIVFATYLIGSIFLIEFVPLHGRPPLVWANFTGAVLAPVFAFGLLLVTRWLTRPDWPPGKPLAFPRRRRILLAIPALAVFAISILFAVSMVQALSRGLRSAERYGWEALRPDDIYAWIMMGGMPTLVALLLASIIFAARSKGQAAA
ncbi:hypothetical protein [Amorphus sp. 3PC139-8]|uniref:hypothetical protein n=1 Tax=Amorphus sp. 3PC139-8 TaxID=2735676 RepID=UPI00345CCF92